VKQVAYVLIAMTCGLAMAAGALAGGGGSIANAPDLPLNQQTVSGWSDQSTANGWTLGEFWRVDLDAGDRLLTDFSGVQQDPDCGGWTSNAIRLAIFKPNVTDYTYDDAEPVAEATTNQNGKREFGWVAPANGKWIVEFGGGCPTVTYEFTAYVQKFTATKLVVPQLARAKHKLVIGGSISGVTSGNVLVLVKGPKGWKRQSTASISAKSTFAWKMKLAGAGKYKVKVAYYGDHTHRASSASATIRAV
jgi:hypothetical protein